MNRNDFNRFITGGAFPGPGDLDGIRELTDMFPWFHAAHLVLLRGLKENADIRFDSQLKSSALSVSDREVLYHYLFMQPAAEAEVKDEPEAVPEAEIKAEPEVEINSEPEVKINSEPEVKDEPEASVEAATETEEEPEAPVAGVPEVSVAEEPAVRSREELIAEIEARLGELASLTDRVLELDHSNSPVNEVHVAAEPRVITEPAPEEELLEFIPDSEPLVPEPVAQLSPADLIDRFIMTSPRIERMTPGESHPVMDLSEPDSEEKGTFITETLARIYVNQGYYSKAINIYEKLSLKYPEKSAYFASRIEKIKELIK